jgi:hypothetical protein
LEESPDGTVSLGLKAAHVRVPLPRALLHES